MNLVELFIDSGAFSAFNQGVPIDVHEYIEWIREHEEFIDTYANLDVIGDPKTTLKNQRIMEKAGLNPLPCFHYAEPIKYLEYYLNKYDYIALGGMVPISSRDLSIWLDRIFSQFICGEDGMPKVKVHGFGLTSFRLMREYPWYTVDSTSWILTGRNGALFVPKKKGGKYTYEEDPLKVNISHKSPTTKDAGRHLFNFPERERKEILEYITERGFILGESEIYDAPSKKYELKDDEKWFGKKKEGKVERIIEEGVSNCYWLRDQLNIIYFLDFEMALPEWPWAFKVKTKILK